MTPPMAQAVLDFWFGSPTSPTYGDPQKSWFIKRDAFDQEIRDRFLAVHTDANRHQLDPWQYQAESCLALIIVLDQFSRNLFRHTPKAYASDEKALNLAKNAILQGFEQTLLPVQRWFLYLPFEHSEQWRDQQRSLQLWDTLTFHSPSASAIEYAAKHAQVVQKFGRFPHRNTILNRQSTASELRFLQQPGSAF